MPVKELLTALLAACFILGSPAAAAQTEARPAAVAGQFYPSRPSDLLEMVDGYLNRAPKAAPGEIVALLVPHAGLEFSGAAAARAYKALDRGRWDAVVLVGAAHYKPLAGAAVYPGDYGTPEGSLPYDEGLAAALFKASPLIVPDAAAHEREHSVEVQIPFLRRRLGRVKLVALVMNSEDPAVAREVGRAIAAAAMGRRVLVIASSDLSHYPKAADAELVDKTTVAALQTLEPGTFWLTHRLIQDRGVENLAVSYCAAGAVAAVLEAAKVLGAGKAIVLERTHSGETRPDLGGGRVVGYAAAVFVKSSGTASAALVLTPPERAQLLGLARRSIGAVLGAGKAPPVPLFDNPRLNLPAAAFVTLWRPNGDLRGCMGTLAPEAGLAEAIARAAILSAVGDKRFSPLTPGELLGVRIEIEILSSARPVAGPQAVRKGDGVILDRGGRTGVFLPQVWERLPGKEAFLGELCRQKLELPPDCWREPGARFQVFSAEAFSESIRR